MSILDAPEMELELPQTDADASGPEAGQLREATDRIVGRCESYGFPHHGPIRIERRASDVPGEQISVIIGPPHLVLRLIPGLYEREVAARDFARKLELQRIREAMMARLQQNQGPPSLEQMRSMMNAPYAQLAGMSQYQMSALAYQQQAPPLFGGPGLFGLLGQFGRSLSG